MLCNAHDDMSNFSIRSKHQRCYKELEQNVHKEQVQGNKLKRNYIQGMLNNLDLITTHGAKEVIYGLIAVSSDTAMVLFDPSASHSFISR